MTNLKETGYRIKLLREKNGITQEELAKIVGYKTKSSINKIEFGITNLSLLKIIKIADTLNTSPGYIIGLKTNESLTNEEIQIIELYRKTDKKSKLLIKQILDMK